MRACPVPSHEEEDDVVCGLNEEKDDEQDSIRFAFFVKFVFRVAACCVSVFVFRKYRL